MQSAPVPSFLTPEQFSHLASFGWEFDPKTNGIHFLMLLSSEGGEGFDVQEINGQLMLWKYEFDINGAEPTTETLWRRFATYDEIASVSAELAFSERGMDISELSSCKKPRF